MTGTRKSKSRGKPAPVKGLEALALEAFFRDGELSGLGVLADYLDETQGGGFDGASVELRAVMLGEVDADAVRFFARMSGRRVPDVAKFGTGVEMARVEAWMADADNGVEVEWVPDDNYSPDDYDDDTMPAIGWGCIVRRGNPGDGSSVGNYASFWGITFGGDGYPDGQDYARYVAVEIASELYANRNERAEKLENVRPCPACGCPYDASRIPPPRVPLDIRCACCCQ